MNQTTKLKSYVEGDTIVTEVASVKFVLSFTEADRLGQYYKDTARTATAKPEVQKPFEEELGGFKPDIKPWPGENHVTVEKTEIKCSVDGCTATPEKTSFFHSPIGGFVCSEHIVVSDTKFVVGEPPSARKQRLSKAS